LRLEDTHAKYGTVFTTDKELIDRFAFYVKLQIAVDMDRLGVLLIDNWVQLVQVEHREAVIQRQPDSTTGASSYPWRAGSMMIWNSARRKAA
jgi:hypothetical protein